MRFNLTGNAEVKVAGAVDPIAKLADNGEVWLWPEGIGHGMCLAMTQAEAVRIMEALDNVLFGSKPTLTLDTYAAIEGNGEQL